MALYRFILNNLSHTQRSPLKTHPWSSQLLHHRFSSVTTGDHEKPDTKQVSIDDSTNKPKKLFSPKSSRRTSLWSENNHRNSLSGVGHAMATILESLTPWNLIRRLKEKDESYNIKYEMPGLSKDEVKITVEDGILFIRGQHKEEGEGFSDEDDQYWSAASYGYYNTSLRLPEDAKVEEITAEMKDGVLHVIIPKDETKKKQIKEVQVG